MYEKEHHQQQRSDNLEQQLKYSWAGKENRF